MSELRPFPACASPRTNFPRSVLLAVLGGLLGLLAPRAAAQFTYIIQTDYRAEGLSLWSGSEATVINSSGFVGLEWSDSISFGHIESTWVGDFGLKATASSSGKIGFDWGFKSTSGEVALNLPNTVTLSYGDLNTPGAAISITQDRSLLDDQTDRIASTFANAEFYVNQRFKIDMGLDVTAAFFESVNVKTSLSDVYNHLASTVGIPDGVNPFDFSLPLISYNENNNRRIQVLGGLFGIADKDLDRGVTVPLNTSPFAIGTVVEYGNITAHTIYDLNARSGDATAVTNTQDEVIAIRANLLGLATLYMGLPVNPFQPKLSLGGPLVAELEIISLDAGLTLGLEQQLSLLSNSTLTLTSNVPVRYTLGNGTTTDWVTSYTFILPEDGSGLNFNLADHQGTEATPLQIFPSVAVAPTLATDLDLLFSPSFRVDILKLGLSAWGMGGGLGPLYSYTTTGDAFASADLWTSLNAYGSLAQFNSPTRGIESLVNPDANARIFDVPQYQGVNISNSTGSANYAVSQIAGTLNIGNSLFNNIANLNLTGTLAFNGANNDAAVRGLNLSPTGSLRLDGGSELLVNGSVDENGAYLTDAQGRRVPGFVDAGGVIANGAYIIGGQLTYSGADISEIGANAAVRLSDNAAYSGPHLVNRSVAGSPASDHDALAHLESIAGALWLDGADVTTDQALTLDGVLTLRQDSHFTAAGLNASTGFLDLGAGTTATFQNSFDPNDGGTLTGLSLYLGSAAGGAQVRYAGDGISRLGSIVHLIGARPEDGYIYLTDDDHDALQFLDTIDVGGQLALLSGATQSVTTPGFINAGTLLIDGATSALTVSGSMNNAGIINLGAGTLSSNGLFNAGGLQLTGGATFNAGPLANVNGTGILGGGGIWNLGGILNYTGTAVTGVASATTLKFNGAGTGLRNSGAAPVFTTNAGTLTFAGGATNDSGAAAFTNTGLLQLTGDGTSFSVDGYNGNGTLELGLGSTLDTTRSAGSASSLPVDGNGRLAPGASWTLAGDLRYNGPALTGLAAGSSLTLARASSDKSLLDATLNLDSGGDSFDRVDGAAASGLTAFSDLYGDLTLNQLVTLSLPSSLTVHDGAALTLNPRATLQVKGASLTLAAGSAFDLGGGNLILGGGAQRTTLRPAGDFDLIAAAGGGEIQLGRVTYGDGAYTTAGSGAIDVDGTLTNSNYLIRGAGEITAGTLSNYARIYAAGGSTPTGTLTLIADIINNSGWLGSVGQGSLVIGDLNHATTLNNSIAISGGDMPGLIDAQGRVTLIRTAVNGGGITVGSGGALYLGTGTTLNVDSISLNGDLDLAAGQHLALNRISTSQDTDIWLHDGATLTLDAATPFTNHGNITLSDGAGILGTAIRNNGNYVFDYGSSSLSNFSNLANGVLAVDASTLTLLDSTFANAGFIKLGSTAPSSVVPTGTLKVADDFTLTGGGFIQMGGQLVTVDKTDAAGNPYTELSIVWTDSPGNYSGFGLITSASGNETNFTNSDNIIQGRGNIGAGLLNLVNAAGGTIRSLGGEIDGELTIDPGSGGFRNLGTLAVDTGATLRINGDFLSVTAGAFTEGAYVVGGTLIVPDIDTWFDASVPITFNSTAARITDGVHDAGIRNITAAGGLTISGDAIYTRDTDVEAFNNDGRLAALFGGTILLTGSQFANYDAATGTLSGGRFDIDNSTLRFDQADIVTNDADLRLGGAYTFTDENGNSALRNLAANTGRLELRHDADFTLNAALGTFTNTGDIVVRAGSTLDLNNAAYTATGATDASLWIGGTVTSPVAPAHLDHTHVTLYGPDAQWGFGSETHPLLIGTGGTLTLAGGYEAYYAPGVTITNHGTFEIGSPATPTADGGTIRSNGYAMFGSGNSNDFVTIDGGTTRLYSGATDDLTTASDIYAGDFWHGFYVDRLRVNGAFDANGAVTVGPNGRLEINGVLSNTTSATRFLNNGTGGSITVTGGLDLTHAVNREGVDFLYNYTSGSPIRLDGVNLVLTDIYPHYTNTGSVRLANGSSVRNANGENLLQFRNNAGTIEITNQDYTLSYLSFNQAGAIVSVNNGTLTTGGSFTNEGTITGDNNGLLFSDGPHGTFTNRGTIDLPVSTNGDFVNATGGVITGSVHSGGELTNEAGATFTGSGSAWELTNLGTMDLNLFNLYTDQPYVSLISNRGDLTFRGSTFLNLVPRAGSPGQYDTYSAFISNLSTGTLRTYGVVTASLWSEGTLRINDPDGLAFDTRLEGTNYITGPVFVDSGRLHLTEEDDLTSAESSTHVTITVASGAALQLDNLALPNQVVLQDGARLEAGGTGSSLASVYRPDGTPTINGHLTVGTSGGTGGLNLDNGHLTVALTAMTIEGDLSGVGTIGFAADNVNPYLFLSGDSSLRASTIDWTLPAITLGANGILTFNSTGTQTVTTSIHNDGQVRVYSPELLYSGIISGTGSVEIGLPYAGSSARDVTFSSAQTYTGSTTIGNNASLTLAGNASLAGSIVNHGELIFDRAGDFTLGAHSAISGDGAITKAGANVMTVADSSFLNHLTVADGTLLIDANTFDSGTLPSFANNAAAAMVNDNPGRDFTLTIDGTGSFQNFSAGDLLLSLTGGASRVSHYGSGTLNLATQSALTPNDLAGGVYLGNYTAHPGSLLPGDYTTPGTLRITTSDYYTFGAAPDTYISNWLVVTDGRILGFNTYTDLAATRGVALGAATIDVGSYLAGDTEIPWQANILAPLESIYTPDGNVLTKTGAGSLGITTPSLGFSFNVLDGTLSIDNPVNSQRTYQGLAVAEGATARFTGPGTAQLAITGGTMAGDLEVTDGKLNIAGSVTNANGTATIALGSGATLWTYGAGDLTYDRILGTPLPASFMHGGTYEGSYAADSTTIGTLHIGTFGANHGAYAVDQLEVSGTTSVNFAAATLSVGDGYTGTLSASALDVSGDFTVNTALSSGGTFTKTGDGTLLLDFNHSSIYTNFDVQAGTLAATRVQTYYGDITGDGAFSVASQGAGASVTLTGTNTYTGGTTVTTGRLILGDGTRLGSILGGVHLADSYSGLAYNAPGDTTFDKTLTGIGYLEQAGNGTLIVNTDLTFINDTVANTDPFDDNRNLVASAGTLRLDPGAAGIGKVTLGNDSQLLLNNAADLTVAGDITGAGSVTKQNTGNATLVGHNTHTGATAVNAGTLTLTGVNTNAGGTSVANGATLALTGTATLGGSVTNAYNGTVSLADTAALTGTLANHGVLSLNRDGNYLFAFTPTGTGVIEQNGDGDLTLIDTAQTNALRINSGRAGFSLNDDRTFASALGGDGRFFHTGDILRLTGGTFSRLGGIDIDSISTLRLEGGSTWDTDFALAPAGRLVTAIDLAYDRAISGDGLMIIESGTLTLTGSADHGTTGTINLAGMLTIADGATLALQDRSLVTGNVTNHGVIDFDNLADYTFGVAVEGTGAFLVDSSGRVELTAASTATGGATVAANSTLALSGDGAVAGTIVNHGTLEVVTAPDSSRVIPANITGDGDLLLSGGGAIEIAGDLAYSGDTFLSDGTTLNSFIHENVTSTFSSVIYGQGNLVKSGAGTLVIVNNSAFGGDVSIMSGTLQIGTGGNTGYLYADNILVNGTLAYNVSTPNQIGAISGFGGIRQMGTGLLSIVADNPNLVGTTTVDAGRILQIGNTAGDAGSVGGEIIANGTLYLNRAGTFTHAGGLSGDGVFQKTLAGDLRLENHFDFAGQLIVGDGALVTDGRGGDSRLDRISATSLTNVATGTLTITGNNTLITTNAGRLTLGDGGSTGWVGSIANSGLLEINRSDNVTLGFGTNVTGHGTITQLGSGTLTIGSAVSAANLTVSNGTMVLDPLFTGDENLSVGSQGTGTLVLYSGTYDYGISIGGGLRAEAAFGDVTLNQASVTGGLDIVGGTLSLPNIAVLNLAGPLSGNGNLQFGGNTLTLAAANTHTGSILLGGGTFGSVTSAGDVASTLNFASPGGTLNFINSDAATFSGSLVNVGAVNFNGTGDATLTSGITSATTLNAGTLTVATGGSVGDLTINHGRAVLDGGSLAQVVLADTADAALDLTAADATLTRLSGGGTVDLGDRTLTLDQSADTRYTGSINGTGGFVKDGFGSFILEGDNTFTGGVTVTEGLLALRGTNTASGYLVENAATLTLDAATNLGLAPAALQADLVTLRGGTLGTESSVALAATQGLTLDGGGHLSATGTLTLNSRIAGSGTLMIDSGRVLFNAADTYAGPIAVNGTLALGRTDAIDPLNTTFHSGSTFDLNGHDWSTALAAQGVTLANSAAAGITVSSALTIGDRFGLSGNGLTHFTGSISAAGGDGSVTLSSAGNVRVDTASSSLLGTLAVSSGTLSLDLDAIPHLAQVNLSGNGGLSLTGTARDLTLGLNLDLPFDVGGDTVSFRNETDGVIRLTTDLGLIEHDGLRRSEVLLGGTSDLTLAGTISGEASLTKVGSGHLTIESNAAGWNNANGGARIGIREGTLTTGLSLLNNRTLTFEGADSHLAITDDVASTYYLRSLLGNDAEANLDLGARNVIFRQNTSGEYAGAITTTGTLTMDVDVANGLPPVPDRQTLGTVNAGSFQVNYGDVTVTTALHADSILVQDALTTTFDDFTNTGNLTIQTYAGAWSAQGAFANDGYLYLNNLANLNTTGAVTNRNTLYFFDSTINATAFHQNAGSLSGYGTINAPLHVNGGALEIGSNSAIGTLTVRGGVTLAPGGVTRWEFEPLDATATAASADLLQITNSPGQADGRLTFAPASAKLPVMVQVGATSFPFNADFTTSHSWTMATTTDGVAGFDPATVLVRPQPGFNLANAVSGQGNFGLQIVGNDVNVVYDPSTVANVAAGTTTLDTPISASGTHGLSGLTKTGGGTLAITTANTYAGYTQMLGGILEIGHNSALSTNAVLWNSGTIRSDGTARSLANNFYLQGNLTVAGAADLTFTGSLTNIADTNRTLTVSNTGLTTFSDIVITGSPTSNQSTRALTVNGTGTALVNGVISDGLFADGRLVRNTGTGTLILADANTYTGGTTINAGTLQLGHGGASGSILGDVTVGLNGTLAFNRADAAAFHGNIAGAGRVTQRGAGTTILTGSNTYTGATTIESGSLQFARTASLYAGDTASWTAANLIVNSGATAVFNVGGAGEFTAADIATLSTLGTASGGFKDGAYLGLDTTHAAGGVFTYNGNLADLNGGANALGLAKLGAGILELGGVNTHSGDTLVQSGTLRLGSDTALSANSTLQVAAGATFDANGHAQTFTTLTGNGDFALGQAALTLNQTADSTYAGQLSGTGSLIKTGAGVLTLTGANTYTGATDIQTGTLIVNGSIADSALTTVGSGATLGGSGTIGDLSLAGILAPGNSPGTLNAGDTTWLGGASYVWEINHALGTAGTHYDFLSITGELTLAATAIDPFIIELVSLLGDNSAGALAGFDATVDYSYLIATASDGISGFNADAFSVNTTGFANDLLGGDWSLSLNGNSLSLDFNAFSAVPEPSTYAAILGALALGLVAWRKRRPAR